MSILTIDLSKASRIQRDAIINFIQTYPDSHSAAAIEHATLAHEHESTMPELAFPTHGSAAGPTLPTSTQLQPSVPPPL